MKMKKFSAEWSFPLVRYLPYLMAMFFCQNSSYHNQIKNKRNLLRTQMEQIVTLGIKGAFLLQVDKGTEVLPSSCLHTVDKQ